MTPRERLLTAMRREVPDRVPFELYFTPHLQRLFEKKTGSLDPADHWGFEEKIVRCASPSSPADHRRYYPEGILDGGTIDHWGVLQRPSGMHHFTGIVHPLRAAGSLKDIQDYPLPPYSRPECSAHLAAEIGGLHDRGIAAHGLMGQTIFEVAWLIRGMEELFTDMLTRPDWAACLLDRICEIRCAQAAGFAAAGTDILRLGDDVGSQRGMLMSVDLWREWLKPRLAAVIAAARAAGPDTLIWYHSDGDCRAIIPELIEIGVDILNPVQPECMDPAEVGRKYGDRLAFSGTIGTQSTMPFGTPQDVRAEVRLRMETIGRRGGLLLAPTHVLEPDVPWENILALVEAVDELGWYR